MATGRPRRIAFPPAKTYNPAVKQKERGRISLVIWILAGLIVVLGSATAAYAAHFRSHALPGVTILGESVTGQSRDAVVKSVSDRAAEVTVNVNLDGKTSKYSLDELGIEVDAEATADAAFSNNHHFGSQMQALYTDRDVPIVIVADDSVANAVVDQLIAETGVPAHDAAVTLAEDGRFTVTPAQAGRSVDASTVVKAATTAAETLTPTTVELVTAEVQPVISTEQAQSVADAANALVALDINISGRIDSHAPSAVQKANWVSIPVSEAGLAQPVLNDAAITEWVTSAAQATELDAVNGVRNVNSNGTVVSTAKEGTKGYKVNNAAAIAEAVVVALHAGQPYTGTFTYDTVEPTYETRVIAAGTENLVYQAAPGEKWIDLNLGNNTVTAYQGATVAMGPAYIVPGMPGMETPTGTFHVYLKYASQTMRGTNLDGTTYVAPDIPWVTYFTGSIAFHGAPWRDSFGWSGPGGSHGCVNMTLEGSKFIYDWAPMGTVVVSHY